MRRHSLPALAAACAALLAACKKAPPREPPPVPITAASVERRAVPFTLDAPGTVGGVLEQVNFREGDEVRAGEVLFRIDPRPYQAALAQARAVLARDEAQLQSARADAERLAALAAKEYVTAQQNEQAKASAAALEATVAADRAAVETARLNLEYATIRAPIDGRAGSLLVRQGNLVRANSGTPLVIINQIRPILVRFAVPATELGRIREHQDAPLAVRARPSGPGPVSVGKLTFVDNAVDTATGTILLKGQFANADAALWPGEFVTASLELYVDSAAVVVPASAVISGQQGPYVFIVRSDRTTEVRDVKVARTEGDVTVIADGLRPGEQVVTEGQLRLTTGAKVQIRSSAGATPAAARGT
jgi:membrane fusion protein, multidrug efflux system